MGKGIVGRIYPREETQLPASVVLDALSVAEPNNSLSGMDFNFSFLWALDKHCFSWGESSATKARDPPIHSSLWNNFLLCFNSLWLPDILHLLLLKKLFRIFKAVTPWTITWEGSMHYNFFCVTTSNCSGICWTSVTICTINAILRSFCSLVSLQTLC